MPRPLSDRSSSTPSARVFAVATDDPSDASTAAARVASPATDSASDASWNRNERKEGPISQQDRPEGDGQFSNSQMQIQQRSNPVANSDSLKDSRVTQGGKFKLQQAVADESQQK